MKTASVAAAGERLLFSLLVYAREKKSLFGFGAEAYVHIWGVPVLDQARQTLRLDHRTCGGVRSRIGLLGAAARTAMPHLQRVLVEKAAWT